MNNLNVAVFNYINHFAGRSFLLDSILKIVAQYLPVMFILVLIGLWFKQGPTRYGVHRGNKDGRSMDAGYKDIVVYSGCAVILGLLLNFIISLFYFHPRPFAVHIGRTLIFHSFDSSFPSDHTTFMLSIAFMLVYFKTTRTIGLILSLSGFVGGLSRVFCGVHWPGDILGSIAVSLAASLVIYSIRRILRLSRWRQTIRFR